MKIFIIGDLIMASCGYEMDFLGKIFSKIKNFSFYQFYLTIQI